MGKKGWEPLAKATVRTYSGFTASKQPSVARGDVPNTAMEVTLVAFIMFIPI